MFFAAAVGSVATVSADLHVTLQLIDSVSSQGDLGVPIFAGGSVYYSKSDSSAGNTPSGLYQDGTLVVPWDETISGHLISNPVSIHSDGTVLLFSARSTFGATEPGSRFDSLNVISGGSPERIVGRGSSLPGYPIPPQGNPIGFGTIDNGLVAFRLRETPFTTPPQIMSLATVSASGGAVTIIANEGDVLPRGGGTIKKFDGSTLPYVHAGKVVFVAKGTAKNGIYEWSGGNFSTVVDSSMGSYGTFTVNGVAKQGSDYVFMTGQDRKGNAIYKIINGQVSLVANYQTLVPGGSGSFGEYRTPSIRQGKLLFHASNNNSSQVEQGIYTDINSSIEPIVDMRTNFSGKTPQQMSIPIGCAWVGDDTTYIMVKFSDYTSAIYRATFTTTDSNSRLPSTVVFTGPKIGIISFPTIGGRTYTLYRSTDLVDRSSLGFVYGNGATMSLTFDDSGATSPKAFFYVGESEP